MIAEVKTARISRIGLKEIVGVFEGAVCGFKLESLVLRPVCWAYGEWQRAAARPATAKVEQIRIACFLILLDRNHKPLAYPAAGTSTGSERTKPAKPRMT